MLNIGDTEKKTFRQVITTIAAHHKKKIRIVPIPVRLAFLLGKVGDIIAQITRTRFPFRTRTVRGMLGGWSCNYDKAVKLLGYQQQYSFETGVQETLQWAKAKGYIK